MCASRRRFLLSVTACPMSSPHWPGCPSWTPSASRQPFRTPCCPLTTVLSCMRTQLTGLKSLALELQHCEDEFGLDYTWQELGRATQLTALDVNLMPSKKRDDSINYVQHAAALSALHVTVEGTGVRQTMDWGFVSCLTALTELALSSGQGDEGIAAIGSCMALRDLTLCSGGDAPISAALAQLTNLTRFNLDGQWVEADLECAQALGRLTHLRWLGAGLWAPGLLPVLQGLPQLSTISGGWEQPAAQLDIVQVPQVCKLQYAGDGAPVEAFPSLISAQLDGRVPPGVLAKLATCCPQLQELELGQLDAANVDNAAVTQGLQSLAGLRHLQHLQLRVCGEMQLAAAASACMVLGQGSLKTLCMSVTPCRFSNLLVLSKLARLDELHLVLIPPSVLEQPSQEIVCVEDAGLLLLGLSAVREVTFRCRNKQAQAVLRAARAWAAECGLPVPCEVAVLAW